MRYHAIFCDSRFAAGDTFEQIHALLQKLKGLNIDNWASATCWPKAPSMETKADT